MSKGYESNKKWRQANPDKRREQVRRRQSKTSFALNGGKQWTEAEEKLVLEHDIPDFQLATKLGRSEHSIQIKRHRLNKGAEDA